jgi:hypothetical protein
MDDDAKLHFWSDMRNTLWGNVKAHVEYTLRSRLWTSLAVQDSLGDSLRRPPVVSLGDILRSSLRGE